MPTAESMTTLAGYIRFVLTGPIKRKSRILICFQYNQHTFVQMVKLYMFSPVSGLYSCPLAMTDGAAKTIQVIFKVALQKLKIKI